MTVLPLIGGAEEREELTDNRLHMEAAPSPCQGPDGCRPGGPVVAWRRSYPGWPDP